MLPCVLHFPMHIWTILARLKKGNPSNMKSIAKHCGKRLSGLIAFFLAFALYGHSVLAIPADGIVNDLEWTPLQVSVFPNIQLFNSDAVVYGINLSALLTNQHRVSGISASPLCINRSNAGVDAKVAGLCGENFALSLGCVSVVCANNGAMVGIANISGLERSFDESGFGLQVGLYNQAKTGVQIGLLNYNKNSAIPVLPFFNCSFPDPESK